MSTDNSNRYAPPTADVTPSAPEANEFAPAGRWRRLFNLALDYVAFIVLSFLVGALLGIAGGGRILLDAGKLGEMVFGALVVVSYYIATEAVFGRSLGKMVTRTYVVSESGARPSFGQIVKRSLIRLVPFEFLSVFRKNSLMWHDAGSGTRVVVRRTSR